MLSLEDNELISRVGPGTPMGTLMRQYWVPSMLSSELPTPDSDPVRILILGEKLVAFRDTNGSVGLVQNNCPHRGASLFFGRNEECGLRCVYHGWKFDTSGNCVDMPNEPAESDFKHKVKAVAYPTQERAGVVWAYMGPRETPPPMPGFDMLLSPTAQALASQQECNWLQTLEGDIDTSHFGFLHRGSISVDNLPAWASLSDYYAVKERAPRYRVVDVEAGVLYGAYRDAEPGHYYWRTAYFLLPFFSMPPGGRAFNCRVPMDDEHTLSFSISPGGRGAIVPPEVANDPAWRRHVTGPLPNTTDWHGRFRNGGNRANDFEIDRDLQRRNVGNNGYSGIPGNLQDPAVTVGMGPIQDRTQEHLGSSDSMIIRTRRRLLEAVRAMQEQGATPPGVDQPEAYGVRSSITVLPVDAEWVTATATAERMSETTIPVAG